ncbi:MAG: hypothetical protein QWI36_02295 [Wolbachia endosymbiont of Tyrophagus putrescentiae]|nr:hypothetical protein [Wolbachia endosymbiont of Tyrophagus putrescentiae]
MQLISQDAAKLKRLEAELFQHLAKPNMQLFHYVTPLKKWYDPRCLLMPVIMPIVRKLFVELTNELAERNFDEVNSNMSDVKPQAIELTQQSVDVIV